MAPPLEILPKILALACGGGPAGEVLAAVSKIRAVMISNDWRWEQLLANSQAASFSEVRLQQVYSAGLARGEQLGYQRGLADAPTVTTKPKGPSIEIQDDFDWLQQILDVAQQAEAEGLLDTFEVDITKDHRHKLSRFGRRTYLSQPQYNSFKRLEAKLKRLGKL